MQHTSYLRHHTKSIAALLLLLCAFQAYGADTFSAGQLSIPSVAIGAATYYDMLVTVSNPIIQGGAPNGSQDTYDPVSKRLMIPSVTSNGTTYTNVVATVDSMVSVGGISGALPGRSKRH